MILANWKSSYSTNCNFE